MPYRAAIDKLGRDLLIMAEMCERSIDTAVMALIDRDEEMAASVILYNTEIDEMENAVKNDCLQILAEPALDEHERRFVAAGMKISTDLERIGDQAVEIGQHVQFLVREQSILPQIVEFPELVEQIEQILRESIESMIERDVRLARKIVAEHPLVLEEMGQIFVELVTVMQKNPKLIERALHILLVAKSLARVAYLAVNLAEEVIFVVEGARESQHIPLFTNVLQPETVMDMDESEELAAVQMVRETRVRRKKK